MWVPLLLGLVLLAAVAGVFWGAWKPFTDDLRESAALKIPIVVTLALVVLVPPVAWAVSLAS